MRGFAKYFLPMNFDIPYRLFMIDGLHKYYCHYARLEGNIRKMNCHGESCPFCAYSDPEERFYALVLQEGSRLRYLDMTAHMLRAIYKALVKHRVDTDSKDTNPSGHLLTITKVQDDNGYIQYKADIMDLSDAHVQKLTEAAVSHKDYQKLKDGLETIIKPGTVKEDVEVIEKVLNMRCLK